LSRKVVVGSREFWTSACVLPGMDAFIYEDKPCREMCFFESDGETLLCGIFDGYGRYDRDKVQFCAKFSVDYYKRNKQALMADPAAFLEALTKYLDNNMKPSTKRVDVSYSGV
jgi:serine/threonine protein phosphatase PrpC